MNPERLTALGRKELYDQLQDRSEAAADKALGLAAQERRRR